jgi:tRNA modification GTPase
VDRRALGVASLDFAAPDTAHSPDAAIAGRVAGARAAFAAALSFETARASPGGEPTIVLAGAPNAGKSSLFNRLARAQHAIVSPVPGTTRDALSARIEIEGVAVRLVDTAGLAPEAAWDSSVDEAARGQTRDALEAADVLVWVIDAAAPDPRPPNAGGTTWIAWNKVDLPGAAAQPPASLVSSHPWVATSAETGAGLGDLEAGLSRVLHGRAGREGAGVSREIALRHRSALVAAGNALDEAEAARAAGEPLEVRAEHFRTACDALDAITGATTPEDVLDRIFARFCLGK